MAQYIDKSALVAEIEKLIKEWSYGFSAEAKYRVEAYKELIYFIESVEDEMEKNRLSACERQTQEEAQRESDFVMGIIKKEHRQPTFSDAIEYGRNTILSELEKIVKDKEEAGKNYVFVFSEIKELIEKLKHENN